MPLKVATAGEQTLDNFFGAQPVVAHLRQLQQSGQIYLWGESGCGKSHLLRACCLTTGPYGKNCHYLDLQQTDPDHGLPQQFSDKAVLAVDNLHLLAGDEQREQLWLEGFELGRSLGQRWLLAAPQAPALCGFTLPDLISRFESGTVYQLQQPQEEQKRLALQQRAKELGFDLSKQVLDYLLLRSVRDMHALFAVLEQLDTASLVQQRKVTVPLLRQLLTTP